MECARSSPRLWGRRGSVASSRSGRAWTRLASASGCWWFRRSSRPPGASGRSSTTATPSPSTVTATRLQLAMLGINPITAHSLLHGYVKLAPGAWLAQTGASSATARYVGALAKHASLRTLNVVRRAESVTSLLDAGADVVLVEGDDLAKQAAVAIGDAPLVLIIDGVAGEPVAQLAPLLKTGGQIVSYTARSRQPLSVSILDLIFRGLSVHGYWLNLWLESTPRETGRPDLPRARRPRRRRHPRRSGRGDLRTSRLPRSDRPCRPQRPQRQGALRSRMNAAAATANPKE
jgi:hypothetical protein